MTTLPATGTYTLEATAFFPPGPNGRGDYTVAIVFPRCEPMAIVAPATINGSLTGDDCDGRRSPDESDFFSFQAVAGQQMTIELASSGWRVDPDLYVTGPGELFTQLHSEFGSNLRLGGVIPVTGAYTIEASGHSFYVHDYRTSARGSYALTVSVDQHTPPCPVTLVRVGSVSEGQLADTDCTAPHRPGTRADVYAFQGTAGQPVRVMLTSEAFNAYLIAYGPDGRTVVEADNSGGGTNARIEGVLPATAAYTIEVTSANAAGVGAYTLDVSAPQ